LSENAALSGHFQLVCAARLDGTTYVSRQSFAAPFHLSKTYWDGDILLVHVINQTAGLFGGDVLKSRVVVESGARVVLSSPSAARFHPSGGREVRIEQRFEVHAGAFLDVFPEISIPQRNSRATQITSIEVEPGGEALYLETLAPGRVASGETFEFDRFAWRTNVRLAQRLVHRERATLSPDDASLAGLRVVFPASYYAGLIVITPAGEKWGVEFSREIGVLCEEKSVVMGATRLPAGGWSIRALADDAVTLRHAIGRLREILYRRLGRPLPDARRF
jgi:urease accessory protein